MDKRHAIETWSAEELEALARLYMAAMAEMRNRIKTTKYDQERAYNAEMLAKFSSDLDYVLDLYNMNTRVGETIAES